MVEDAKKAALRLLKPYGEPTLSLPELRAGLDKELGQLSLARAASLSSLLTRNHQDQRKS